MTVKDCQVVAIHPSSTIDHRPEWVLYHEFVLTKRNFIRTVTCMKGEWLFEVAAEYFNPDNIRNIETKKELERIEREMMERKKKGNNQQNNNTSNSSYQNLGVNNNIQRNNNIKGSYKNNNWSKKKKKKKQKRYFLNGNINCNNYNL